MRGVNWCTVWVVMLLLAGCSSLPDIRDDRSQVSLDGQILLKRARQLSMQNKADLALREATRAYENFTLSDDLSGRVLAGLDIARFNRKLGKPEDAKAWAEKSHRLVRVFVPSLMPNWQLLKAEFFFAEAQYDSVLRYTQISRTSEEQDETVAHLFAYRLMAGLQVSSYDADALKHDTEALEKIVPRLEEKFEEYTLTDPFVLSFAEYALGYAAIKQQAWERAARSFEKALAIDRQFGNFRATADNLYGLGIASDRREQPEQARGYFERAHDIYYSMGDTLAAQRATFKILVIKLESNEHQEQVIKELEQLYLQVHDERLKQEIDRILHPKEPASKE
ncbi:MAG: tetratricopeptide repeat protein [Chlorobiales bacterium]|jgi:hypothetical protein|nr:tetratricopeptide repeat protein [Chlorobiales bacterium]